jgi:hypothetical protein
MSGAGLPVQATNGNHLPGFCASDVALWHTNAGRDGRYVFLAMPAGRYVVFVTPACTPAPCAVAEVMPGEVAEASALVAGAIPQPSAMPQDGGTANDLAGDHAQQPTLEAPGDADSVDEGDRSDVSGSERPPANATDALDEPLAQARAARSAEVAENGTADGAPTAAAGSNVFRGEGPGSENFGARNNLGALNPGGMERALRGTVFQTAAAGPLRSRAAESHVLAPAADAWPLASGAVPGALTQHAHGMAAAAVRTAAWDAFHPFALATRYNDGIVTNTLVRPADTELTFAARAGGGFGVRGWRQKLAGLAAWDGVRQSFDLVSSPSVSSKGVSQSVSPQDGASFYALTATQRALLGTRGVTAPAIDAALNFLDSLAGPVSRTQQRDAAVARLDFAAAKRDTMTLSYSLMRSDGPATLGSSQAVIARGRASIGHAHIAADAGDVRWLHRFSPHAINDVKFEVVHALAYESADAPLAQEPAFGSGGSAPQVSIQAGEFLYGTPARLGRDAYPEEWHVALAETAQWAARGHVLTFGAAAAHIRERAAAATNRDGSFSYDSGVSTAATSSPRAGGLVDWITDATFNVNAYPNGGCPAINAAVHLFCFRSFTQSFGEQQTEFALGELAVFAHDRWRVRDGLTVSVGARYEYVLLPLPQQPNPALDGVFGASGATSIFPEDRNNLGPRVGVAWSPHDGRWGTLQAGAGTSFGHLPGQTVLAALANTGQASAVTHIRITPQTVTACPQGGAVPGQGFGYPCVYTSAPPAAVTATTTATVFAHSFRLPAVVTAELQWQRELLRGVQMAVGYSGAFAVQLPKTRDINIAPATSLSRFVLQGGDGRAGARDGETFVVPLYTARVATQWGPVSLVQSNANATFHALQVEAEGRHATVAWRASYVWSKALDDMPERGRLRVNAQFDPFAAGYDKGRADADVPQQLRGAISWSPRSWSPRVVGGGVLAAVLRDWRLSAAAVAGSGRAYSYQIFGGPSLVGGSESLNGSGGSVYLPTAGRNTLRMPARAVVDARVARGFRLGERMHGSAFVTASNLGNHLNATRVNARAYLAGTASAGTTPLVFQNADTLAAEGLPGPPFGTVEAAGEERRLRAGIRVEF